MPKRMLFLTTDLQPDNLKKMNCCNVPIVFVKSLSYRVVKDIKRGKSKERKMESWETFYGKDHPFQIEDYFKSRKFIGY